MRVTIDIGDSPILQKQVRGSSRMLGYFIKPALEGLVKVNRLFLRTHNAPPLYRSGVRYMPEPDDGTDEEFAAIPVVMRRGWGDCDDLAPWRVAELQEAGENATIGISWKRPGGKRLYHVFVYRGNGHPEDPSRVLGMI